MTFAIEAVAIHIGPVIALALIDRWFLAVLRAVEAEGQA